MLFNALRARVVRGGDSGVCLPCGSDAEDERRRSNQEDEAMSRALVLHASWWGKWNAVARTDAQRAAAPHCRYGRALFGRRARDRIAQDVSQQTPGRLPAISDR